MVRHHPVALGAAEAMQAAELLFAMLLGVLCLHEAWPWGVSLVGALLAMLGIVAFAGVVACPAASSRRGMQALRGDRGP